MSVFSRRHLLLRGLPSRPVTRQPCLLGPGERAEVLSEIVTVHARLPFQQPRVHAGSQLRVLAPIDDALETRSTIVSRSAISEVLAADGGVYPAE